MKSCGKLMRLFAVIAAIAMSVLVIIDAVSCGANYSDSLKNYEENYEEHEEAHDDEDDDYYYNQSKKDCSSCESYKENIKYYERLITQNVLNAITNIILYGVYCAVLYALGEIATRTNGKKDDADKQEFIPANTPIYTSTPINNPVPPVAPAYIPAPAPAPTQVLTFCANCGSPRVADERFCSKCGNAFTK